MATARKHVSRPNTSSSSPAAPAAFYQGTFDPFNCSNRKSVFGLKNVSALCMSTNDDADSLSLPEDFDVDNARAVLENIIRNSPFENSGTTMKGVRALPDPSSDRLIREKEISLLRNLAPSSSSNSSGDTFDDTDAIAALWDYWFNERGDDAAQKLFSCEAEASRMAYIDILQSKSGKISYSEDESSKIWLKLEKRLRDLAMECGNKEGSMNGTREVSFTWVEPLNRLATLLFQRGKFKESIALCRIILTERPWHFGALSGIVLCYRAVGNVSKAELWARQCLPNLDHSNNYRARKAWVEKAVTDAEKTLEKK
eukprot:CAMPEP_0113297902 /NCGR_PEP_ID=MMETSP0010_2-20120614/570_1 /TAXON_ID=216773 ORGANISM="Corethron hystrix, Strain 308" /NCGR_SAMPLE_ID=MMETSP0010_2 /ASSEMBLY_ACC=CAM_ASM_000155 /LENGTH=312 /DNA_ID=CAMNT_0000150867 /DNA_START=165 /DNA_END=1104 /DNA_ORIENTATION=+ /assembly_acc=CAM_ASM_000155